MTNFSAPVIDRTMTSGCGCFADVPPMPMGCAVCGHAPYAHGCPGQNTGHEYEQPSGALMGCRRRLGLGRVLPGFEPPAVVVAPIEVVPLVPAQRRHDLPVVAPSAPAVPAPLPKRVPQPVRRPASLFRPTATPRRAPEGRPAPRGTRAAVRSSRRTGTAPLRCRPHASYGVPQIFPSHLIERARPALATNGRALDRTVEVQSMHDRRSAMPESATSEFATSVIPGWRVIRSDAGRYWASRVRPFTAEQLNRTDAYRTVDADTLDGLRAETARQEEAAEAVTP